MQTSQVLSSNCSANLSLELPSLINHTALSDFEKCLSQFSTVGRDELIENIVAVVTGQLAGLAGEELLLMLATVYVLERSVGRGLTQFYQALASSAIGLSKLQELPPYESLYGTVSWMDVIESGVEKKMNAPQFIGLCQALIKAKFMRFRPEEGFDSATPAVALFGKEYQARDARSHWCALCFWLSKCITIEEGEELIAGFVAAIKGRQEVQEILVIAEYLRLISIHCNSISLPQFLWKAFVHTPQAPLLNAVAFYCAEERQESLSISVSEADVFHKFILLHAVSKEVILCVLPALLKNSAIDQQARVDIAYTAVSFLYKKELRFDEVKLLLRSIYQIFPAPFVHTAWVEEKSSLLVRLLCEAKWILGNSRELFALKSSPRGFSEGCFLDMLQELVELVPEISTKRLFQDTIRFHFIKAIIAEVTWLVQDANDRKVSPRGRVPLLVLKKALCRAAACMLTDICEERLSVSAFYEIVKLTDQSSRFTQDPNENIIYDKEKGAIHLPNEV